MKPLLAIATLLLVPFLALAQPPVPIELKVQPGRMLKLTVNDAKAESVLWDSPSDAVDLIESETGKWAIFSCLDDGTYRVSAWACVGGKVQRVAWYRIIVGKGQPLPPVPIPPGPGPGPNPPDPPAPVVQGKRYVICVEETGQAVLNRAAFFSDKALFARLKDKGHGYRIVDKDVRDAQGQVPADVKRFIEAAAGKQLPQVFITDERGNTLIQANLPATPAELLALLTKYGG